MKISKTTVDRLRIGDIIADDAIQGFRARRLPSGRVTYTLRHTNGGGKRREISLGLHGNVTAEEARVRAKKYAGQAVDSDPFAEQRAEKAIAGKTVGVVFDDFFDKYVLAKGLRSADEIKRNFDRLVRPRIGERSIYDIKRSDIVELVDRIVAENGECMAQNTFAYVRKAFNWFAQRNYDFRSPIVAGMAPTKPSEHQRDRILTDEEIIDIWRALDQADVPSCYPAYVRALLLTGQRRANVAEATRDELDAGHWNIPAERMKGGQAQIVPLTPALQTLFGNRPGSLFSTDDGKTPFSGFSKAKRALDAEIKRARKAAHRKPMPHWTHHDLRRTARSIMSRYATPDIAERVLGHVIPGIRGTYDRYDYAVEKQQALEKLAQHVNGLVNPKPNKVVRLKERTS
jgi:integrase